MAKKEHTSGQTHGHGDSRARGKRVMGGFRGVARGGKSHKASSDGGSHVPSHGMTHGGHHGPAKR
jgi:hypothetical protein